MKTSSSKLFNKIGYISIKDYVEDFALMMKFGPWKLPLGVGDFLHLFFLKIFAKFSWFSERLFILHVNEVSPSYSALLMYLKKNLFYDVFSERNLIFRGYSSFLFEKDVLIGGSVVKVTGQGVSEDVSTALSMAIGEMLERLISGVLDANKAIFLMAPIDVMGKYPVVYPPKYHNFLNVQKDMYKELNHNPKVKINWVKGENLITNQTTFIPRQMTSWLAEKRRFTNVVVHTTSNGSAGYFTKDGAVLRGLLEVVQRDGFLVHWLTTTPPQLVENSTLPQNIQKKIKDYEAFGISLYILNVTSLSIPSIFVAVINRSSEVPQVVLSGSSSLTFDEAISGALKEVNIVSDMFYYSPEEEAVKKFPSEDYKPFTSNLGKIERQLYWRGKEKVKKFEWFITGKKVSYQELCKQDLLTQDSDFVKLRECLRVLRVYGEDYYPVVYSPKHKIQNALGYYVAQVYIPKAFPLYLVERYGTFDSLRLKDFTSSRNINKWELNKDPHMFS